MDLGKRQSAQIDLIFGIFFTKQKIIRTNVPFQADLLYQLKRWGTLSAFNSTPGRFVRVELQSGSFLGQSVLATQFFDTLLNGHLVLWTAGGFCSFLFSFVDMMILSYAGKNDYSQKKQQKTARKCAEF